MYILLGARMYFSRLILFQYIFLFNNSAFLENNYEGHVRKLLHVFLLFSYEHFRLLFYNCEHKHMRLYGDRIRI